VNDQLVRQLALPGPALAKDISNGDTASSAKLTFGDEANSLKNTHFVMSRSSTQQQNQSFIP